MSAPSINQVSTARTVPRENRSLLVAPPLKHAAGLALKTAQDGLSADVTIGGSSLHELRAWVRQDILHCANDYARHLSLPKMNSATDGPLIVGGHQPSLFHCGVLLKNFAVSRLATHTGGVGLNLLVDNDLATNWHVEVPTGSTAEPQLERLSFDSDRSPQPWEGMPVLDKAQFSSFGQRLSEHLKSWNITPLATRFWAESASRAEAGHSLSDCLVASRVHLQSQWNALSLELPVSRLSESRSFLWFMALLLQDAERFAQQHNVALALFRKTHHVRSRTHPAADLLTRNTGIETGFWCWRSGDTHRQRLLVRLDRGTIVLGNNQDIHETLPAPVGDDFDPTIEALLDLQQQGLHLRPSALTTTLFARLFLANLFVHGIGGSRYDEVTDRLIQEYFGIPAPSFLTISGTLHLPLGPAPNVTPADRRQILDTRRRLEYNALQILDADEVPVLRKRKQTLLREQQADKLEASVASRTRRRARFREFQALNKELANHTGRHHDLLSRELASIDRLLAARAILTNREFSFWLYPENTLRTFLDEALSTLD